MKAEEKPCPLCRRSGCAYPKHAALVRAITARRDWLRQRDRVAIARERATPVPTFSVRS